MSAEKSTGGLPQSMERERRATAADGLPEKRRETMEKIETSANEIHTRTFGVLRGRRYELVTYRGGRVEIYEEYSDIRGLSRFLGYVEDVLHHFPATYVRDLAPMFAAHAAKHAEFWGSFLPGADVWIQGV